MIKQAQTTPPYKSSNSQSNSPANCCKTQQIYEQKVFLSWRTTEVTLACLLDCGHGCGAQGLTWQHSAPGLSSSAPFYVSPAKQQRIFFLSLESKLSSRRGKQEAEGSDCGVSASCFHFHQVPSMKVPTKAPWKSGPRWVPMLLCQVIHHMKGVGGSVLSNSLRPCGLQPARLLCPWNPPGKNPGTGLPFPSPGDFPNPGIGPGSPALQTDSLLSEPPGKPSVHHIHSHQNDLLQSGYSFRHKTLPHSLDSPLRTSPEADLPDQCLGNGHHWSVCPLALPSRNWGVEWLPRQPRPLGKWATSTQWRGGGGGSWETNMQAVSRGRKQKIQQSSPRSTSWTSQSRQETHQGPETSGTLKGTTLNPRSKSRCLWPSRAIRTGSANPQFGNEGSGDFYSRLSTQNKNKIHFKGNFKFPSKTKTKFISKATSNFNFWNCFIYQKYSGSWYTLIPRNAEVNTFFSL